MLNQPVSVFRPTVSMALLLAGLWTNIALGDADCDEQPILDLAGAGVGGMAQICDTPVGLKAHFRANGLAPGEAYTVWWIYIDDPSQCVPDPSAPPGYECDYSFLLNDGDPLAAVGRFDSGIAPENGMIHFKSDVPGMHASSGSMTWLVLNAHGPAATADGRALARQLLTPEDAFYGAPHLGIVGGALSVPTAFSIHVAE